MLEPVNSYVTKFELVNVNIYSSFNYCESLVLLAKFQDHQTIGSEEECFKVFYIIYVWQPYWSCALVLYMNFHSDWAKRFHKKVDFICSLISEEKRINLLTLLCINIVPGQGPVAVGDKSMMIGL